MDEPFICDECGRPGTRAPGTGWCTMCEQEYQTGYHEAADPMYGIAAAIDYTIELNERDRL